MDKKQIIDGLKFTLDMCLFNPSTGEVLTKEQVNDMTRWTAEACEGALELLGKHGKWIKERDTLKCSNCEFGYFPASYFFGDGSCKHTAYKGNYKFNFCPDCGAYMVGELKNE